MYVIMNEDGLFWYDFICGYHVWKSSTRATLLQKEQAEALVKEYGLEDCKVVLWRC